MTSSPHSSPLLNDEVAGSRRAEQWAATMTGHDAGPVRRAHRDSTDSLRVCDLADTYLHDRAEREARQHEHLAAGATRAEGAGTRAAPALGRNSPAVTRKSDVLPALGLPTRAMSGSAVMKAIRRLRRRGCAGSPQSSCRSGRQSDRGKPARHDEALRSSALHQNRARTTAVLHQHRGTPSQCGQSLQACSEAVRQVARKASFNDSEFASDYH